MPDTTPHSQPPAPSPHMTAAGTAELHQSSRRLSIHTGYNAVCANTPSTVSLTAEVGFIHIGNSSLKGRARASVSVSSFGMGRCSSWYGESE